MYCKQYGVRSLFLLCILCLAISFPRVSQGQKLKTLAANTFNGAMTGGILGGATMALQNSDNFDPVRFGVGLGTLGGLGIGAHDVAYASNKERYIIDGTFNRGYATTVIILLDTMYGGATGAVVGSAITLMLEDPIVDGLQYGSGVGLWGGFLFGLMDAFYFSTQETRPIASRMPSLNVPGGNPLTYQDEQTQVTFLKPDIYSFSTINKHQIQRQTGIYLSMLQVSVNL